MSADTAKRMAMTMVAVNRPFSRPRRVWNAELKLSDPPKAPPTCAPVFWSNIAATSTTERIICTYGRRDFIGL